MSGYTPGPWKWEDVPGAGLKIKGPVPFMANCVEYVLRASDQHLFTVAYETWIQFPPKEWTDMQEANARLITAAPELLEACKAALERQYNPFEPDNQSALYLRLQAVIQKAEGAE